MKISNQLLTKLREKKAVLWINPNAGGPLPPDAPSVGEIHVAAARLQRFSPLLAHFFTELAGSGGAIDSDLTPADSLRDALNEEGKGVSDGAWFIKRDDQLPVAGSIKARGGFHEVLAYAETVALKNNLIVEKDDRIALCTPTARAFFAQYAVAVGSTGNLGLSIGLMAAALGFETTVHMSADAKEWKKARLRKRGVRVVEHVGDYAKAVAAGRAEALAQEKCHFVDDEQSPLLFFGYAAAAYQLAAQLAAAGRIVDAQHPLFVYLPCGVGGAPGGITFGLKAIFGEHVHCFFAEPVASPCMLVQLCAEDGEAMSVYDIGLDNRTEADGLAVGQASHFVAPIMKSQLAGVFTATDEQLFLDLLALKDTLGIEVEPSAAAGVRGPYWISCSEQGQRYIKDHHLNMRAATHIIWSTGGSLVPREELDKFQNKALTTKLHLQH